MVIAVYSSYGDYILTTNSTYFSYVYLTVNSVFIILVSYLLSLYSDAPIEIFSADSVRGLFGVFASWYLWV